MGYVLIQGLLNNKASPRVCLLVVYFGKGTQETEMEGRSEAIVKRGKAFVQTWTKEHRMCLRITHQRNRRKENLYLGTSIHST